MIMYTFGNMKKESSSTFQTNKCTAFNKRTGYEPLQTL